MGSFRSKFSIKIFGHRHMSNISEWGNAKASHKSPKICLFSILQALISVRFASNQPHFWSPCTYLTSIFLQWVRKHFVSSNNAPMLLFLFCYVWISNDNSIHIQKSSIFRNFFMTWRLRCFAKFEAHVR